MRLNLEPLCDYLKEHGICTVVEIGSYKGFSTIYFATRFSDVVSIDPFAPGYDENDPASNPLKLAYAAKVFRLITEPYRNIRHIKKASLDAVKYFLDNTLEFVYIDGCHTYNAVLADINAWLPKVRKGGFIGGHDYGTFKDVRRAVEDRLGRPMTFPDSSWLFRKKG